LSRLPARPKIYLADSIRVGEVAHSEPGDPGHAYGVNLDFAKDGRLLGIEVLDAEQAPSGDVPLAFRQSFRQTLLEQDLERESRGAAGPRISNSTGRLS